MHQQIDDTEINITLLTTAIGAEVDGVDLTQPLSNAIAGTLRDLLARHNVLFFRAQHLNLDQKKRFTASFGSLLTLPYVSPLDGDPEVIRVYKGANEGGGVFGGDWHTDFSFLERPPAGSVLSAVTVPPQGGDTLWASQAAAWDALPAPLQELLITCDAVHVGKPYGVKWSPPIETQTGAGMTMSRGDPSADEDRLHPAVLTHPVTGRKMLFLNPTYTVRMDGMSEEESRPILDAVQRHCIRPEFTCRFRWSPGTVAIWDNLATQHYAVNDYQGHEREMFRTTFGGATPRELTTPYPRSAVTV
ncbi:MAG: taurine dioxygenase [Alphaproteobacteria bacterium]|nr:taurine dioxygenase [Alphaproteobacteria bacterium]